MFEGGTPRPVEITQLLDRTWSRGRFRRLAQDKSAWRARLLEDAFSIAIAVARARPTRVGLIAYKHVSGHAGREIKFSTYLRRVVRLVLRRMGQPVPSIRSRYWNALKGSNDFVDCDFGVLYGTPFNPRHAIQARAIVLGASVDELREQSAKETYLYRGRLTTRWTHESPKMQAAWDALVHAEHVQGLGRFVRGDRFPGKGVLVFSSNPLRTRDTIGLSSLCEECLDFDGAKAVEVALELEPSTRSEAEVARIAKVGRKVASRALELVERRGEALRLVPAPQEDSFRRPDTSQRPGGTPGASSPPEGAALHVVPAPQEDSRRRADTSQRGPEFRPNYLPWRDALEGLLRTHGSLGQVSAALGGSPSKASLSRYLSGKQSPPYETEVAICREYLALEADADVGGAPPDQTDMED